MNRPAAPPLTGGRILAGGALGFVVGLITMILWVVLVGLIHINVVFAAIGVGYAVGWAVWKGCGQGGKTPSIIAGVLALVFSGLGAFLTSSGSVFGVIFSLLCVGYGTMQGYGAPNNLERKF